MNDKLYAVYGAGNDAVGLVERMAAPLAELGANLIDLRQDSLHGLFTVYLVVDASATELRLEQLKALVARISEDTGLDLHVSRYVPSARPSDSRNLRLTLLGRDRPGIIATVSRDLSAHKINIEFSRMIAREGIFLMELMTDVSHSSLPPENLENTVKEHMAAMGIATMFQRSNVFNPRPRTLLLHLEGSLLARPELAEVREQARLQDIPNSLLAAAGRLEGLPLAALEQVVSSLHVSRDSAELIQSLRRMGFGTMLLSQAFTPFAEVLRERLGLEAARGGVLAVDDDSQTLTGQVRLPPSPADFLAQQGLDAAHVLVLTDEPGDSWPLGLRLELDMRLLLELLNSHVLSRESLSGLLAGFGELRSP